MNFHEIYADLTPSQRDFVNQVYNEANALRDKGGNAYDVLNNFSDKVRTGQDWDAKNRTGDKALVEGNISNEYLGNFVYGMAGTILGIEPELLLAGAAAQQQMLNGNNDYSGSNQEKLIKGIVEEYVKGVISDMTNGFEHNPFNYGQGDNPGDSQKIFDGINAAQGMGYETSIGIDEAFGGGISSILDGLNNNDNIKDLANALAGALGFFAPQWLKDFISDIYDPLVLDLNNDGKISLSENNIYFDHNGDNIAFLSSWISPNDGLLVYDRNANGKIDNGSELFGNFTLNSNGELASNGFVALSDLDSNNDGIIDISDSEFVNLQIWQDLNGDGIVDDGELKSLLEFDIESLNLNAVDVNQTLGNGNTLTLQSTFTKTDGSIGLSADINFSVDTINREFKDEIELNLTADDLARPNLKGTGFLRDLRVASALDENLANLIDEYSVATTKETQLNLLDEIISSWAKTSVKFDSDFTLSKATESGDGSGRTIRLTPTKYNAYKNFTITDEMQSRFDAIKDKLAVINAFTGRTNTELFITSGLEFENIINQTNKTYEAIKSYAYKSLLTQTRLKDYLNLISLDINEVVGENGNANFEFSLNYDEVIAKFNEVNQSNPKKAFIDLAEFIDLYKDKSGISNLMMTLSNFANLAKESGEINEYLKELCNETIKNLSTQTGSNDNDTLIGTGILNGIDTLYGNGGDDMLIGGSGDDYLNGGNGSDIYEFSGDFGNDTIYNHDTSKGRFDTIKFTDDTTKENLKFEKSNNDLIIKKFNSNATNTSEISNNSITIADFFKDDTNLSYIVNAIEFANGEKLTAEQIVDILLTPTNGNDNLEVFFANRDYTINALGGDDIITTKNGNDTIHVGSGNDTIDAGSGNDIIFGDSGDDSIYGGDGNDTLIGGKGNDFLQGGQGNDTYIFNAKFDNDTILNFKPNKDEIDTIKFTDLKARDLNFIREFDGKDFSNDLIITTKNGSVRVQNFFDESSVNESYKIDFIKTKDKILTISDIKQILTQKSIYNDQIQAFDNQTGINGGFGNDILKASSTGTILNGEMGNDILISGKANDRLYGGYGNDKYIYTKGSGSDTIQDNGGNDTLVLKGISQDETKFAKSGKDLIISFTNSDDTITIKDHFKWLFGKPNKLENIIFDKDENLQISQIDSFINNKWNKMNYNDLSKKFETNITESIAPMQNSQICTFANSSKGANLVNSQNSPFISQNQIDKIIEQVSAYNADSGYGNFAFDDMRGAMNLQIYVS